MTVGTARLGEQKATQGGGEGVMYPEEPPAPERGAPVSPSPMRGTATENARWDKTRLADRRGRAMDWRSILDEDCNERIGYEKGVRRNPGSSGN